MQKKNISHSGFQMMALFACAAVMTLITESSAYPQGADPHSQFLGGPYELLVQRGMKGAAMTFPVEVPDENAPGKLETVFPVMGSPVKIKLDEFVPELVWEQYTERSQQGGFVAKVGVAGPSLDQEIWLCSDDKAKQSISSAIGGIAIKKIHPNADLSSIAKQLADPNAVGILSVFGADPNSTQVHVVKKDSVIQMTDKSGQFKVLEYMPHYSVDPGTGKIINASSETKNPAIRVQFTQGDKTVEQWLFARFSAHPHIPNKIPVRTEFSEVDLGATAGNYIILVCQGHRPQILFAKEGRRHAEPVKLNESYLFANQDYHFSVEEVFSNVVLKQRWKSNRNQLLNPAVIATVDRGGQTQQVVLELNKLQHIRSDAETIVLQLRRKVEDPKHLD